MAVKLSSSAVICFLLLVLLLGSIVPSSGQGCSFAGLNNYCLPAYQGGAVTGACCSALRSFGPCFCRYAKNPTYRAIIYSAAGHRIASSCGLRIPGC